MPQCHRCERVQATAELRRTPLGHVCKDNDKWSRCYAIARELRAKRRKLQKRTPLALVFLSETGPLAVAA